MLDIIWGIVHYKVEKSAIIQFYMKNGWCGYTWNDAKVNRVTNSSTTKQYSNLWLNMKSIDFGLPCHAEKLKVPWSAMNTATIWDIWRLDWWKKTQTIINADNTIVIDIWGYLSQTWRRINRINMLAKLLG